MQLILDQPLEVLERRSPGEQPPIDEERRCAVDAGVGRILDGDGAFAAFTKVDHSSLITRDELSGVSPEYSRNTPGRVSGLYLIRFNL